MLPQIDRLVMFFSIEAFRKCFDELYLGGFVFAEVEGGIGSLLGKHLFEVEALGVDLLADLRQFCFVQDVEIVFDFFPDDGIATFSWAVHLDS